MGNGQMIKLMDMVDTDHPGVHCILATGKTISKKDMAAKKCPIILFMRENFARARRMGMEHTNLATDHLTKDTSKVIYLMEKVYLGGLMIKFTTDNGNKTKCTDMGHLSGQTAEYMKDNLETILNTVKANSLGPIRMALDN